MSLTAIPRSPISEFQQIIERAGGQNCTLAGFNSRLREVVGRLCGLVQEPAADERASAADSTTALGTISQYQDTHEHDLSVLLVLLERLEQVV